MFHPLWLSYVPLRTGSESRKYRVGAPCKAFFLSLSCAYTFTALFAQQSSQKFEGQFDVGIRQAASDYSHQEYKEAENKLQAILARTPQSFAANELMGLVLSGEGRDSEATSFFVRARQATPNSIPARENLAANYLKLASPLAEGELLTLVKLQPKKFESQHNLGEFYISHGDMGKALPYLRAAYISRPDDYANGFDMSLVEVQLDRLASARDDIQALLRVKDTAELHSLLADVFEKQHMYLLAAKEYQRAAEIEPTEDAIFDWGNELVRHQNFKEAVDVFSSGVELYPQSWRILTGLGMSESLLGHLQQAVTALLDAVNLNPEEPKSYLFLSMLEGIPPDRTKSVADLFKQYAKSHPDRAQAQLYYANSLLREDGVEATESGNSAEIESLLRQAISLDPTLAGAHLQLGIFYARQERQSLAATEFEAAIRFQPTLAVAHYRYSQALMRLGNKERARQELAEFRRLTAVQMLPDAVSIFLLTSQ